MSTYYQKHVYSIYVRVWMDFCNWFKCIDYNDNISYAAWNPPQIAAVNFRSFGYEIPSLRILLRLCKDSAPIDRYIRLLVPDQSLPTSNPLHSRKPSYAVAVWLCMGSMTVSTSTFGMLAPVPPRFVDFAFGFLV